MFVKPRSARIGTVTPSLRPRTIVHASPRKKPTCKPQHPRPSGPGHAEVNGVNYYYAVYGTGEPRLLSWRLGQSRCSVQMTKLRAEPAGDRRRSAEDTADADGRCARSAWSKMGDRTWHAMLLKKLPCIESRSGGRARQHRWYLGGVAFQSMTQHPELFAAWHCFHPYRGRVLSGDAAAAAATRRAMAEQNEGNADVKWDVAFEPNPEEFPKSLDTEGCLMRKPTMVGGRQVITMPV